MTIRITALTLLLAPLAAATAQPAPEPQAAPAAGDLVLACTGGGKANKPQNVLYSKKHKDGHHSLEAIPIVRHVRFHDQVDIEISGDSGRIRMPRTMLPAIHGGEGGWMPLNALSMTAGEITASIAVNALNNPKLHLDRVSGEIDISGKAGKFAGRCVKAVGGQPQTAF